MQNIDSETPQPSVQTHENGHPFNPLESAKKLFPLPRRRDFLILNLGLLLTAAGIVLFKAPNHFAMGGTSGLAILLAALIPQLNVGTTMFIVNALLIVLGYIVLGRGFGGSTVYSSVVLSLFTALLEWIFDLQAPLTNDTLLELIWAVLLPALGGALVFNVGSSTGGTDIIAMILNQKTNIEVGKALLISDLVIAVAAGAVFNVATFLYCVLGTLMKSTLIDSFIEGLNVRKKISIVTRFPDCICQYIIENLRRSATVYDARGAYTDEKVSVVETILNRRQALELRNFIRKNDPEAFISILNSSEIIGKGFREV